MHNIFTIFSYNNVDTEQSISRARGDDWAVTHFVLLRDNTHTRSKAKHTKSEKEKDKDRTTTKKNKNHPHERRHRFAHLDTILVLLLMGANIRAPPCWSKRKEKTLT